MRWQQRTRAHRWDPLPVVSVGALFTGLAAVIYIVAGLSLWAAIGLSLVILGGVSITAAKRLPSERRRVLATLVRDGALAGLLATLAYDLTRFAVAGIDPSPYNPYEAIRMFGQALAGGIVTGSGLLIVGGAFHAVNGTLFGIAFRLFVGDSRPPTARWVPLGLAWGMGLELFQLALYPGWLHVSFYDEFLRTSVAGHLAYGAVLGATCFLAARKRQRGPLEGPR